MNNEKTTLQTGKYTIEQIDTGFAIFSTNLAGAREWVATTSDPAQAMTIVEGLVLVEQKRFYYPETTPVFQSADEKPLPPFLKKTPEKS